MKTEKRDNKKYLPEHIRKVMHTNVPIVKKDQRVRDVSSLLKKESKSFETVDYIYVVDKNQKLVGVFSIKDVFKFSKNTPVKKFMQTQLITVSPKTDIEVIAHLALRHGIKAVPVVESGKLIGVVSPKSVVHILNKSLRKDIFHFAGIHGSHLEYENTLTVPFFKSIMHRTPWLVIGLIGIIITAAFMGIFKEILEEYIILAFFIPAIVYMSDALGTQIQTLFIRDLAFMGKELNTKRYLLRQMSISFLIAFIVGIIMFFVISIFWKHPYIAFVVGLATFITLIITSFTAFAITLVIKKLGYDPALGGGPFATVISDATSIFIYFIVATLFL